MKVAGLAGSNLSVRISQNVSIEELSFSVVELFLPPRNKYRRDVLMQYRDIVLTAEFRSFRSS